MRRLVSVLSVGLWGWGCGDNGITPIDAPGRPPFTPAPHVPLPSVSSHHGAVLSSVHLVTLTFDDYVARPEVEAFGDAIVGSPWYKDVGMEYGVQAGTHVGKLSLGPSPASITRTDIVDRITRLALSSTAPALAAASAAGPGPGRVPGPTPPTSQVLYMMYIPPAVIRGADLQNVRGYHQMIMVDGVGVPIAVVLDDGSGLANTTLTAAHQLINAVTNPYDPPYDGYYTTPLPTDPWSLIVGEIADLCHGEDPIVEGGFTLPRVYSNTAAGLGNFPCKPAATNDAWTDVSAEPSSLQLVRRGGSVTFTLTGWSTQELPDWKLGTHVADFSKLDEAAIRPELSHNRINNNTSVQLTLHVPDTAVSGSRGGVYVLSGANVRPWLVGFIVQ